MPGPNLDPRWAELAARARAARQELDKLDVLTDQLEAPHRAELATRLIAVREGLDGFDAELEAKVAGL